MRARLCMDHIVGESITHLTTNWKILGEEDSNIKTDTKIQRREREGEREYCCYADGSTHI